MIDLDYRGIPALIAAAAAATLISLVLYRRTSPTLARKIRLLLGTLRWLAAFMLLVLVIDPSLRFAVTTSSSPTVCVLVDDSGSMGHPVSEAKLAEAAAALSGSLVADLEAKSRVRFFTFSDTLGEMDAGGIGAVAARGARTDLAGSIGQAIKACETRPSALVLATDGAVNFGEDPLHFCSTLKLPVYVISVARSERTPDISLDRVEAPDEAYAASETPVAIYLSGRGSGTVTTTLTVADSAGEVFRATVAIPPGGATQRIPAAVGAGEVGLHAFSAALAPFEGEAVTANNSMDFSLKVIKGKIRVLVVAPRPSWDFAFVRRALEADPAMEVVTAFKPGSELAIGLPGATNDPGGAIGGADAVVVLRGASLGPAAKGLERFVWEGGGALLVAPDATGDVTDALNPLTVVRRSQTARDPAAAGFSPVLAEAGAGHEILDIDAARGGRLWPTLPPVPVDRSIAGARSEASVLVTGMSGPGPAREGDPGGAGGTAGSARDGRVPLVAVMKHGLGRVAAFAGYDLWRWDLVPRGFGSEVSAFSELVTSSVRWAVRGEEAKRLTVAPSKTDYLRGEPIALAARAVDENLKPKPGLSVEAKIVERSRADVVAAVAMVEKSAGNHFKLIDLLPPGAYVVRATASLDGQVYAEDAAGFTVSRRGLEDSNFDGDVALLEELARSTGGRFYEAGAASGLAADLNPGRVIVKTSKDWRLRLTLATFLVLVCLLGVEWLIRRRKMLA